MVAEGSLFSIYRKFTCWAELLGGCHVAAAIRRNRFNRRNTSINTNSPGEGNPPITWESANKKPPRGVSTLWVHAASLGEGLSVLPLIKKIENDKCFRKGGFHILMTFSSSSGIIGLSNQLAPSSSLTLALAPLDFPNEVKSFVDSWNPFAAIWVESEFWPNTLNELSERDVPLCLVQARLSERSFLRWNLFPATQTLLGGILDKFLLVVSQSKDDRERLQQFMSPSNAAAVKIGDLKRAKSLCSTISVSQSSPRWGKFLRERGIVAVSTHPGEEEVIANMHLQLCRREPATFWVTFIAPRHPERCLSLQITLQRIATKSDSVILLFSQITSISAKDWDEKRWIILVDSLGNLDDLLARVDMAFIGASLPRSKFHGQHNVFEPLGHGCGLILQGSAKTGPPQDFVTYVENQEDLARYILAHTIRHPNMLKYRVPSLANDIELIWGDVKRILLRKLSTTD